MSTNGTPPDDATADNTVLGVAPRELLIATALAVVGMVVFVGFGAAYFDTGPLSDVFGYVAWVLGGFVGAASWALGGVASLFSWAAGLSGLGQAIFVLTFLAASFGVMLFIGEFAHAEQARDPGMEDGTWTITNVLRAFIIVTLAVPAILYRDVLLARWMWGVGLVGLLLLGYVAFVFFQERQRRARTETAVRRTQGEVSRNVESLAQVIAGFALIGVSMALALITGVLQAVGGLDQYIQPLMNEIGFLLLTFIGYANMGGDGFGAWLVPEMSPLQWVGLALALLAAVLIFRD